MESALNNFDERLFSCRKENDEEIRQRGAAAMQNPVPPIPPYNASTHYMERAEEELFRRYGVELPTTPLPVNVSALEQAVKEVDAKDKPKEQTKQESTTRGTTRVESPSAVQQLNPAWRRSTSSDSAPPSPTSAWPKRPNLSAFYRPPARNEAGELINPPDYSKGAIPNRSSNSSTSSEATAKPPLQRQHGVVEPRPRDVHGTQPGCPPTRPPMTAEQVVGTIRSHRERTHLPPPHSSRPTSCRPRRLLPDPWASSTPSQGGGGHHPDGEFLANRLSEPEEVVPENPPRSPRPTTGMTDAQLLRTCALINAALRCELCGEFGHKADTCARHPTTANPTSYLRRAKTCHIDPFVRPC